MKKGKLIVLEGSCDGIGKSTQYDKLYNRLINEGYSVVKHHFPSYNTKEGSGVEKYLKGEFGNPKDLSPYFINSLYAHDRAVTWYETLKKEYDEGKIILLDRYTTSSLIYQSSTIENKKDKVNFLNYVSDFEYNKIGIKEPDMVIFLTMPFDLASEMHAKRKENDGIQNDIHESNIEFMKGVYDNSWFVAKHFNFDFIECSQDNKIRTIEDIHEEIYQKVLSIIKK